MSTTDINPETVRAIQQDPALFAERLLDTDLFAYQREWLRAESDRKAMICGRQVGKTEVCAVAGLHEAATNRDETVLITAPTQRQSSELFKRVKDCISRAVVDGWDVERETQTIVEFGNGSRIICLPSGTDGNSIRGYTADYIIVDEAAFVNDQVFTSVLLPMLATTDGTLALASTPFGKQGFLYEEAYTGGEDWHITEVPSRESPLVDESFVEEQRETLSALEFRQEIEGEFVEAADAFFTRDLVASAIDADAEFRPQDGCVLGVDLARHGQDRTVILPLDANGVVGPIRRSTDWSLTAGAGAVADAVAEYDPHAVRVDETGVGAGAVEMLQDDVARGLVEGVKFTVDRKQSLYNALKSDLERGAITLPDDRLLRRELVDLEYEFTRGGKTKISHPDGGHDDHPDALTLAAAARRDGGSSGDVLAFQL
jgi:hypothetical protein